MIDILIAVGVAAVAGGLLGRFGFVKEAKGPKYTCPWELCGYPLPETPLIAEMETARKHAIYAAEPCGGCGKTVKFCRYKKAYLRYIGA